MKIVNRPQLTLDERDIETLQQFQQIVTEYYNTPDRDSFAEYLEQNYCIDNVDLKVLVDLYNSF